MPIEVDRSEAPRLLRYRYWGPPPSSQEQADVRLTMIASGELTDETSAVMDLRGLTGVHTAEALDAAIVSALRVGGWPCRRAYVVLPWMHEAMMEMLEDRLSETITMAAFIDVGAALQWLTEAPEG